MIITLTGFMGCGKSSVGRRLSELLCCRFMDLDKEIEEREGRSITEIFAEDGEAAFRRMERETLEALSGFSCPYSEEAEVLVLALGGGTVMTQECEHIVHADTFCIYLKASVETLMEHLAGETDKRPILNCCPTQEPGEDTSLSARIKGLMAQRSATYEKAAHLIIDTDGLNIDDIAASILSYLSRRD